MFSQLARSLGEGALLVSAARCTPVLARGMAKKVLKQPEVGKKKQLKLERVAQRKEELRQIEDAKIVKEDKVFTPEALGTDLLRVCDLEQIHILTERRPVPVFSSGSTLRVTFLKAPTAEKETQVTGICISKRNKRLGSTFTLRNVNDGVGYEVAFDTYSPLIKKIEVLELARRRRAKLYYLRDRPLKESTVSPNFQSVPVPADGKVPVKQARMKR